MPTISQIALTELSDQTPHDRAALVIGNSSYCHASQLANPVNDAHDMDDLLKRLACETTMLLDADQRSMKSVIDEFCDNSAVASLRIIFYAGHGIQYRGENFLIPVDADITSERQIEYDCVPVSRILAGLGEASRGANVLILDACRDNPFGMRIRGSRGTRGLATMSAPSGSLICYATAPGCVAIDGNERNGIYTGALLRNLPVPGEDLVRICQRVRREVMEATSEYQIPWESTSLTSDLVLLDSPLQNWNAYHANPELSQIVNAARDIDNRLANFVCHNFSIPDRSTEGAAYEVWVEEGNHIRKTVYVECWESGRLEEAIYGIDDRPRLAVTETIEYEIPISVIPDPEETVTRVFTWLDGESALARMLSGGTMLRSESVEDRRAAQRTTRRYAEALALVAKQAS